MVLNKDLYYLSLSASRVCVFCYETWRICEDELRPYIQPSATKGKLHEQQMF